MVAFRSYFVRLQCENNFLLYKIMYNWSHTLVSQCRFWVLFGRTWARQCSQSRFCSQSRAHKVVRDFVRLTKLRLTHKVVRNVASKCDQIVLSKICQIISPNFTISDFVLHIPGKGNTRRINVVTQRSHAYVWLWRYIITSSVPLHAEFTSHTYLTLVLS